MLWYAKFESIWSVLDGSLAIQVALLRCLSSAAEPATFFPDDTPTFTVRVMSRELPLHCPPSYLQLASSICSWRRWSVWFCLSCIKIKWTAYLNCVLDFCEAPAAELLPEYVCEYAEFLYVSVLLLQVRICIFRLWACHGCVLVLVHAAVLRAGLCYA